MADHPNSFDARATLRSPPSAEAAAITHGAIAAIAAGLVHGLVDRVSFWPDIAIALWLHTRAA